MFFELLSVCFWFALLTTSSTVFHVSFMGRKKKKAKGKKRKANGQFTKCTQSSPPRKKHKSNTNSIQTVKRVCCGVASKYSNSNVISRMLTRRDWICDATYNESFQNIYPSTNGYRLCTANTLVSSNNTIRCHKCSLSEYHQLYDLFKSKKFEIVDTFISKYYSEFTKLHIHYDISSGCFYFSNINTACIDP